MNFKPVDSILMRQINESFIQTTYITFVVSILVLLLGLLIGIYLYASKHELLLNNQRAYKYLSGLINILRAIPFIILLIILMPLSNILFGKITGPNAAIPALVLSVSPFFARMVETGLNDLNQGIVELGISLGMSKKKIITKLLLKEAKPSIISSFISTIISIISFSAMAGVIGAGGLGSMAYTIGFQRNNGTAIVIATGLILLIVFITQFIGTRYVNKIDHR